MTFEDYWEHLVELNPSLGRGDTRMTIAVYNFKAQLRKAYKAGSTCTSAGWDPVADLFERLRK